MKPQFMIALIASLAITSPVNATDYIHRDIMANTLPGAKCEAGDQAEAAATKPYTMDRFSKKFCQSQGYGWHLEKIVDKGKTLCNNCGDSKGLQKCHQEDVTVTCKRIKPGSVGMLPGQG